MVELGCNAGMTKSADIRRIVLALLVEKYGLAATAKRFKKPDRQINDMLAGRKSFGEKVAREMEENYSPNRSAGWLDTLDQESNTLKEELRGSVPLISWVQAGAWCASSDIFHPGDADEFYPTTAKVSKNAYALRVRGDSMEPGFPDGCVIIVDPDREARHGSYIVVRETDSTEATFKQLQIDGPRKYLKPLNPRYPLMELRFETLICGVAVKMEMDVDN